MTIDLTIVGLYLLVTLIIGFYKGKSIKSIQEYAVANKNYSTLIIITTIFATFIGGGATIGTIEKIHSSGIYFGIIFIGIAINMLILAKYLAPKMDKFKDCISCGDMMHVLYGRDAQILTGLAAFLTVAAIVAAQITAMGYIVHYFTGMEYKLCAIISAGVVVLYSAFGGIKAVTLTDFFQFWIIIIAIPILCNIGLMKVGGYSNLIRTVPPQYIDIGLNLRSFLTYAFPYFLVLCMPFQPTMIQRMLIARNGEQIRNSMKYAAYIAIPFTLIIGVIGLITISLYPNVESSIALPHLVSEIAPVGFKGLIIAGFLAIIMSTSDSFLNTAAVSLVHDTIKPILGDKFDKELPFAKMVTFVTGGLSILIATSFQSVIDIMASIDGVWTSTITVPLFFGVMGLTISRRGFMVCVTSGAVFYAIWQFYLMKTYHINSAFMGLVFSLGVFFILYTVENTNRMRTHLKQISTLLLNSINRLASLSKAIFSNRILTRIVDLILKYSTRAVSTHGAAYLLFGGFAVINYFIPVFMWSNASVSPQYYYIVAILRITAGILCSALIFHKFWPSRLKRYLPLYWHLTLFYCLPFMTTFMLLLNEFSTQWLMNLAIALFCLVLLVDWLTFVVLFVLGATTSALLFNFAISPILLSQINIPYDMVYLYIFTVLIGGLFSRNNEYIHQKIMEAKNAMNSQLKTIVEERTTDLREALSAKKEFLGKVSHEVRTPLHGIIGISKDLAKRWEDLKDAEKRKMANVIADSGDRLMNLMSNILDLSQFSAGKIKTILTQDVDIAELIQDVIKTGELLVESENKDITFRVDIGSNLRRKIECDATRITQVLINLINNAVSYSEHGEILVKASDEAGKLKISVTDSGVGIPENELNLIFEAFTQSSRTKDPSKGKGLGLALCREIIGLHTGYIQAQNNKGKPGSTFSFVIPYTQTQHQTINSSAAQQPRQLTGKILLVDDEQICLETGSMLLSTFGLSVVTAGGGKAALAYLKAHPREINLVLLDMMMPDMYGLNVLEAIKADPELKHIPIVIQSGLTDKAEVAKTLKAGAEGHLPKPWNRDVMHSTIAKILLQEAKLVAA